MFQYVLYIICSTQRRCSRDLYFAICSNAKAKARVIDTVVEVGDEHLLVLSIGERLSRGGEDRRRTRLLGPPRRERFDVRRGVSFTARPLLHIQ